MSYLVRLAINYMWSCRPYASPPSPSRPPPTSDSWTRPTAARHERLHESESD